MNLSRLPPLPDQVLQLATSIEAFAGREIEVRINPYLPSPTDPFPNSPAAMVTETSAAILIRESADIEPQGVLHELLHIERYWVLGIPQIVPRAPQGDSRWEITSAIENSLEHLAIVPREADYGFDPYTHWNFIERELFASYPWTHLTEPTARRRACLLGSLAIDSLVTDASVRAHAMECIRKEGYQDEARHFLSRILRFRQSKIEQLKTMIRFLKIPEQEADFVWLDPQRGVRRTESASGTRTS